MASLLWSQVSLLSGAAQYKSQNTLSEGGDGDYSDRSDGDNNNDNNGDGDESNSPHMYGEIHINSPPPGVKEARRFTQCDVLLPPNLEIDPI